MSTRAAEAMRRMGGEVVASVKGYVARALAPLEGRIEKLEVGGVKNLADTFAGAFEEGTLYRRGQTVVHGGSLFLCLDDTRMRPAESRAWVLITKRGKDAR